MYKGNRTGVCRYRTGIGQHELARRLYISEKTLYRCFTKVVGTSPKNFQAITRARTALIKLCDQPAADFSPYDHGYYDMSHFYKSVVKIHRAKTLTISIHIPAKAQRLSGFLLRRRLASLLFCSK